MTTKKKAPTAAPSAPPPPAVHPFAADAALLAQIMARNDHTLLAECLSIDIPSIGVRKVRFNERAGQIVVTASTDAGATIIDLYPDDLRALSVFFDALADQCADLEATGAIISFKGRVS